MTTQTQAREAPEAELPRYHAMLLAADASDHANRGIQEAVTLAGRWHADVTATHAYAAKMHDIRFRQMEGGLPEQFRKEDELERQRDIHDSLITRGLSIITDSYLDQAERICNENKVPYKGRSLEGKNYRALTHETNSGNYDLLVIGALGLGAIKGSRVGTVCDRVVRRSAIDCLVIKNPQRDLSNGPIVAAIDGSTRAFGGLLTAMSLAQEWQVPLHVISAFDPYYHYVAFNRIAGVLSEEAGKVFRFKEQEKLHEEIIDSGLAKIYEGHLLVAQSIADEYGIEITTKLLDGKAHDAVEQYVRKLDPSLLVIGKLGIHADDELDIGGNAENLLRNVDCSVLLSQREFRPRIDVLAAATTTWTHEAEANLARAPDFVQNMARMAILRYAQQRGHTVITARIVDEATAQLMPGRAEDMLQEIVATFDKDNHGSDEATDKTRVTDRAMVWETSAQLILDSIEDTTLRNNLKMRAEKKARAAATFNVAPAHIEAFIETARQPEASATPGHDTPLHWTATALARLLQAPEGFMRDMSKRRIEEYARSNAHTEITLETAEAGLTVARKAMEAQLGGAGKTRIAGNTKVSKCPFAGSGTEKNTPATGSPAAATSPVSGPISGPIWTDEARLQLQKIPQGYCRDMTVSAAETIASQKGLAEINLDFIRIILSTFSAGSKATEETLPWDESARARIASAPAMVRGMLLQEIEGWARRKQLAQVTEAAVEAVKETWAERGIFHLDPADPRNSE
ncbi:MAG: universal stress protein [Gammaproteobacteria bacterium]|nr:universal stress protein [Gammaproteobacteria bacterium]